MKKIIIAIATIATIAAIVAGLLTSNINSIPEVSIKETESLQVNYTYNSSFAALVIEGGNVLIADGTGTKYKNYKMLSASDYNASVVEAWVTEDPCDGVAVELSNGSVLFYETVE